MRHVPPSVRRAAGFLLACAVPLGARAASFDAIVPLVSRQPVTENVYVVARAGTNFAVLSACVPYCPEARLRFVRPDGSVANDWRLAPASVATQLADGAADGLTRIFNGYSVVAYGSDGGRLWSALLEPDAASNYEVLGLDGAGNTWLRGQASGRPVEIVRVDRDGDIARSFLPGGNPLSLLGVADPAGAQAWLVLEVATASARERRVVRVRSDGTIATASSEPAQFDPGFVTAVAGDGFVVASRPSGQRAVMLQRFDGQGLLRWTKQLDGIGYLYRVSAAPDGSVAIGVDRGSPGTSVNQAVLLLDATGALRWERAVRELAGGPVFANAAIVSWGSCEQRDFYSCAGARVEAHDASSGALLRDYRNGTFRDSAWLVAPDLSFVGGNSTGLVRVDATGQASTVFDASALREPASFVQTSIAPSGATTYSAPGASYGRARIGLLDADGTPAWQREITLELGDSSYVRLKAGRAGPVFAQIPGEGIVALARATGLPLSTTGIDATDDYGMGSVLDDGRFVGAGGYRANGVGAYGQFAVAANGSGIQALSSFGQDSLFTLSATGYAALRSGDDLRVLDPAGREQFRIAGGATGVGIVGPNGEVVVTDESRAWFYDARGVLRHDVQARQDREAPDWISWVAFDGAGGAVVLDKRNDGAVSELVLVRLPATGPARELARYFVPRSASANRLLFRDGKLVVLSTSPQQLVARVFDGETGARLATESFPGQWQCLALCTWRFDDAGNLRGTVAARAAPERVAEASAVRFGGLLGAPRTMRLDQAGIRGAWYDPATAGQGFTTDWFPESRQLFAAWFTHAANGENGARAQRWLTLSGGVPEGASTATLDVYENTGGNFDAPPATTAVRIGTARISMRDCSQVVVGWELDAARSLAQSWLPAGEVVLARLGPAPGECATTGVPYRKDVTGSWYRPTLAGQGLLTYAAPGFVFGAWYAYDDAAVPAAQRAPQRWFSLQGEYAPTGALDATLYQTTGGRFATEPAGNTRRAGAVRLEPESCDRLRLSWQFDDDPSLGAWRGRSGARTLERLGACND